MPETTADRRAQPGTGRDRETVTITLHGRFDGSTVALARASLHAVIEQSDADLTVDVGDADWIDVPALAVLVDAHRRLRVDGRRLAIRSVSDNVRRILAVTGLRRVIPVHARARGLVA